MGDARDMGQWVQAAVVVVKTLRWRGRFGFWPSESGGAWRRCSDVCREGAQTHRTGKKEKKKPKKSEKRTYWFKPPQKHRLPQVLHVSCVCVALARASREARGGGVRGDGIGRVFVGTLRWRGLSGVEGRRRSTRSWGEKGRKKDI